MLWNVAPALTRWKYHLFLEELSSYDLTEAPIYKNGILRKMQTSEARTSKK